MRTLLRGRRYVSRRVEGALLGRPPSSDESGRWRPHAVGCLLVLIIVMGGAATAVLKPAAVSADAPLVMSRQSGALFVRIDGSLRPVANMASARLILGTPASPRVVDDNSIGPVERGPIVGIAGAPQRIEPPLAPIDVRWTVCENPDGATTVGISEPGTATQAANDDAVLARSSGDGLTYLLYGGRRAVIDITDPAIERTFRLAGVAAASVSPATLNLLPEVSPIEVPHVPQMGEQSMISPFPNGSILRVDWAGNVSEYFVVLRDGLQRIGPMAADLVRLAGVHTEIVTVSTDVVVSSPLVDELQVGTFPDEMSAVSGAGSPVCVQWQGASTTIVKPDLARLPDPVKLAQADGPGPAIDFVGLPVGRSADVVAVSRDGRGGGEVRYLVTGAGVAFALHDPSAAAALGLTNSPADMPAALLAGLPAGPELSQSAALLASDVLGGGIPPPPS